MDLLEFWIDSTKDLKLTYKNKVSPVIKRRIVKAKDIKIEGNNVRILDHIKWDTNLEDLFRFIRS